MRRARDGRRKIFSEADYRMGYEDGTGQMVLSLMEALEAIGIDVTLRPVLEAGPDDRVQMYFKVILSGDLTVKPLDNGRQAADRPLDMPAQRGKM